MMSTKPNKLLKGKSEKGTKKEKIENLNEVLGGSLEDFFFFWTEFWIFRMMWKYHIPSSPPAA